MQLIKIVNKMIKHGDICTMKSESKKNKISNEYLLKKP